MINNSSLILSFFPHHGQCITPLKWQSASGSGYWLGSWPLGTLRGMLDGRISTLLAGLLGHSWHTAVHSALSKSPWFCGFHNWVGWQIQSCSRKCLPCYMKFCCWSAGSFPGSNPLLLFPPIWKHPAEGFLVTPWQCLIQEGFLLLLWMGAPQESLWRWSPMGWRFHPVGWVVSPLGTRQGPGCYWGSTAGSEEGESVPSLLFNGLCL